MSQRGNYTSISSVEHKIKTINKSINIATICYSILFLFMSYHFIVNTNRLNEHKKVIELMNEANKSQQESINLLMKNQILLNNKLKRYERNK